MACTYEMSVLLRHSCATTFNKSLVLAAATADSICRWNSHHLGFNNASAYLADVTIVTNVQRGLYDLGTWLSDVHAASLHLNDSG